MQFLFFRILSYTIVSKNVEVFNFHVDVNFRIFFILLCDVERSINFFEEILFGQTFLRLTFLHSYLFGSEKFAFSGIEAILLAKIVIFR